MCLIFGGNYVQTCVQLLRVSRQNKANNLDNKDRNLESKPTIDQGIKWRGSFTSRDTSASPFPFVLVR